MIEKKKIAIIGINACGLNVLNNLLYSNHHLYLCTYVVKKQKLDIKIKFINPINTKDHYFFKSFESEDLQILKKEFSTFDKIYVVSAFVSLEFTNDFLPLLEILDPKKCKFVLGFPLFFEGRKELFDYFVNNLESKNFESTIVKQDESENLKIYSISERITSLIDLLILQLKIEIGCRDGGADTKL